MNKYLAITLLAVVVWYVFFYAKKKSMTGSGTPYMPTIKTPPPPPHTTPPEGETGGTRLPSGMTPAGAGIRFPSTSRMRGVS